MSCSHRIISIVLETPTKQLDNFVSRSSRNTTGSRPGFAGKYQWYIYHDNITIFSVEKNMIYINENIKLDFYVN